MTINNNLEQSLIYNRLYIIYIYIINICLCRYTCIYYKYNTIQID